MAKGVEEFWKILHPNIEEIKYSDSGDRMLILRHLDEINKDYDEITNGYRINGLKIDERKIVKGIVDHYRVEEYLELLYPGYSKMSALKRAELGSDKAFMQRHVDDIKEMFSNAKLKASQEEKDITQDREREILQAIVREKKAIIKVDNIGKALGMPVPQVDQPDKPGADRPEGPE